MSIQSVIGPGRHLKKEGSEATISSIGGFGIMGSPFEFMSDE
jgi:hypothetical protein